MMEATFWIGVVAGGVVGGGGLTMIAAGALTNRLRDTFITKGDAMTLAEIEEREDRRQEQYTAVLQQVEKRILDATRSGIDALDHQIKRDHEAFRRELDRLASSMESSARQAQEAERLSREALHKAELTHAKAEGVERLLDTRLGHIQDLLQELRRKGAVA